MREARRRGEALLALGMLVALCRCVFALDPALDANLYDRATWRLRDGFTRGTINALAQTREDYLWLGAEFGLVRFDSARRVAFEPASNQSLPSMNIPALLRNAFRHAAASRIEVDLHHDSGSSACACGTMGRALTWRSWRVGGGRGIRACRGCMSAPLGPGEKLAIWSESGVAGKSSWLFRLRRFTLTQWRTEWQFLEGTR
jgi:hypothetical protein